MHSSFGRLVGHLHLSEPEFYSSEKKYKYLFTTPQQGLKRYWEKRRDDSLMLATIHGDTWKVLNMQHITPNSKSWDYSDMPGGGVWKIKGPTYLVDGSHQDPSPHPHLLRKKDLLHQEITMLWLPYLSYLPSSHKRIHWLHVSCEQLCDMRIEFSNLFNHSRHFQPSCPSCHYDLFLTWTVWTFTHLVFGKTVNISHSWFQCPGH